MGFATGREKERMVDMSHCAFCLDCTDKLAKTPLNAAAMICLRCAKIAVETLSKKSKNVDRAE